MKSIFLILVIVILFLPGIGYTDCEKGCKTKIILLDCDNEPVTNADIEIEVCCGNEKKTLTKTTDINGSATFNYCLDDICGRRIKSSIATVKVKRENCTKTDKKAVCQITICNDGNSKISNRK